MNTLENKAKFFAQYWGQRILTDKYGNPNTSWIDFSSMSNTEAIKQGLILLKPLSSISDKDAVEVANLVYTEHVDYVKRISDAADWVTYILNNGSLSSHRIDELVEFDDHLITLTITDLLRSKGYALTWNGITVEQQIEYGWIKLIK